MGLLFKIVTNEQGTNVADCIFSVCSFNVKTQYSIRVLNCHESFAWLWTLVHPNSHVYGCFPSMSLLAFVSLQELPPLNWWLFTGWYLLYHQALFIFQIIYKNGCIYGLIQMMLICCHRVIKPWLGHSFLQQPVTIAAVSLCSQFHASHAVSTIPSLCSPVSCPHGLPAPLVASSHSSYLPFNIFCTPVCSLLFLLLKFHGQWSWWLPCLPLAF